MFDIEGNTYQISSNISIYTLVACQDNEKEVFIVVGVPTKISQTDK